MNEIANKFLLAGDKFTPEMHLRQPGFTYIACGQFTKNKERRKRFKETGDWRYIYQNELDKACFQNMSYGDFKDSNRRTFADKVLRDRVFNIARDPKYDGYQDDNSLQWFITFLIKKTSGSGIKNENMSNKE